MPFPTAHYVLQFGGDLAPDEIWSNSIRLAAIGEVVQNLSPAQEVSVLPEIKTLLTTWMENSLSGWSVRSKLRYIKLNLVGTDGTYVSETSSNSAFYDVPPYVDGTGNSPFPNSTAMVVSWATAAVRGRASKGRIFVPSPSLSVIPETGRWALASIQQAGAAAAAFLEGLRANATLASINAVPVVGSKLGTGLFREITAVRVGDVPDTMRSRRNAQQESYYFRALE